MKTKFLYRTYQEALIFFLVYVLLCSPLILRSVLIENTVFSLSDKRFMGLVESIKNDISLYIVLISLLYAATLPRINKIANVIIKFSILVIFAINLVDYFVILNFGNKLSIEDITKYGSYSLKYLIQIYDHTIYFMALFFLSLTAVILYFTFKNYKISQNKIINISVILMIASFVVIPLTFESHKSEFETYEVLLKYTAADSSKNLNYSSQFKKDFSFTDTKICAPSKPKSPNIIILMVESLSSYHSQFFSGLNNFTPHIDKIAKDNIAFTNFHANGSFTENGELALLTGLASIKQPKKKIIEEYCSHGFFDLDSALPKLLKKQNYHTEFLTSSTLKFANTGKWAKSIGFDYMEDSTNKFYENYEKFVFDSTADQFLLQRVLQRVNASKKPNFTFVKTVTSHIPYIHPVTKIKSEAGAIKYSDQEIGKFYQSLKKSKFFDNGILIIVGDHHTPEIPTKEEVELYGYVKAQAMVPMIISYGDKKPEIITKQFQQTDIYNYIKNLTSSESCHSNWHGDVFNTKHNPRYVLFKREDRKHIVTIFEDDKLHEVILDADNTRLFDETNVSKETAKYFINKINEQRIKPLK